MLAVSLVNVRSDSLYRRVCPFRFGGLGCLGLAVSSLSGHPLGNPTSIAALTYEDMKEAAGRRVLNAGGIGQLRSALEAGGRGGHRPVLF